MFLLILSSSKLQVFRVRPFSRQQFAHRNVRYVSVNECYGSWQLTRWEQELTVWGVVIGMASTGGFLGFLHMLVAELPRNTRLPSSR